MKMWPAGSIGILSHVATTRTLTPSNNKKKKQKGNHKRKLK